MRRESSSTSDNTCKRDSRRDRARDHASTLMRNRSVLDRISCVIRACIAYTGCPVGHSTIVRVQVSTNYWIGN